jgi:hydroxymethylpyrimidine pyrophosphatase-like HAD family hydrolase
MIPVEAFGKTLENDTVCCFKTDVNLLEFQDRRNSKGSALKWYCEQNNIPLDQVLALGDAENDMAMLEEAGWSVAVANAMPVVKEMCDDVTEFDAAHDGAGDFLLKHLLD